MCDVDCVSVTVWVLVGVRSGFIFLPPELRQDENTELSKLEVPACFGASKGLPFSACCAFWSAAVNTFAGRLLDFWFVTLRDLLGVG